MSDAFPLCRESRHEDALHDVLDTCVRFVTGRLSPPTFVALALTGSFARGEGTVLARRDHLRILGDMEFFVVVDGSRARGLRRELAAWGREATATLSGRGVRVHVEFGAVPRDYLVRRARPSIFLYDLATHGKVLAGERDALRSMISFPPGRIPPEDGLWLLFNRTIEQLEAYDRLSTADDDTLLEIAYERMKLVLDLAGSALAFTGAHTSSYVRRPPAFAHLAAETPSLQALLPSHFQGELKRAAALKILPAEEALLPSGDIEMQRGWLTEQIVAAAPSVAAVLRWELERTLGGTADLADLLDQYTRATSLRRRIRDWAKLALHPMPAPLPLSCARAAWLARRSTPRNLLYTAGMLAYLSLAVPRGLPAIARLLPLPRHALPLDAEGQRRTITALWRWCIRNG